MGSESLVSRRLIGNTQKAKNSLVLFRNGQLELGAQRCDCYGIGMKDDVVGMRDEFCR